MKATTSSVGKDIERSWPCAGALASGRWLLNDDRLPGLVDKANDMGRQVSALPPEVEVIESELENFPYQRLRKSKQTTVIEAATHMAAGTTGTAFNVLSMYKEPLDEYAPLFDRICRYRPFYQKLQSALGRSMAKGIWPAWNRDIFSTVNPEGEWLSDSKLPFTEAYVLGEVGIPLCYHPGRPHGDSPRGFSGVCIFSGGTAPDICRRGVDGREGLVGHEALRTGKVDRRARGGKRRSRCDRGLLKALDQRPVCRLVQGWPAILLAGAGLPIAASG